MRRGGEHPESVTTYIVAMIRPGTSHERTREASSACSLQVQTVLYGHSPGEIWNFIEGVRAAARCARTRGVCGSVTLALGDSSTQRLIDGAMEEEIAQSLRDNGVDRFHYLYFGENRGSAGGQNSLFRIGGRTDFVFVTNPDAYLCPDVFCELLPAFREDDVGIVEARQLPLEHPKSFDPASGETGWASGACMMVSAEVLDEVGDFDHETFFLYCDDVDFSWRTRLAGFRIIHRPSARVFHDKRLSPNGTLMASASEFYYSAEAALLMAWKYSRPDLVEKWSNELLQGGIPEHRRAVDEFRQRKAVSRLPRPLDPEGSVASFFGYNYAEHRFGVGG